MSPVHNFTEGQKFEFDPNGDEDHIRLARSILGNQLVDGMLTAHIANKYYSTERTVKVLGVDQKTGTVTIGSSDEPERD